MIFVTVGTHEQPFNRLIDKMDSLVAEGHITETVFIQRGFHTRKPSHCESSKLIGYHEMVEKIENARIVICHGGPGSIMMPWSIGKVPIVVPRQLIYNEHVDDHQVDFVSRLEAGKLVLTVLDIDLLLDNILEYESLSQSCILSDFKRPSYDLLANKIDRYCQAEIIGSPSPPNRCRTGC